MTGSPRFRTDSATKGFKRVNLVSRGETVYTHKNARQKPFLKPSVNAGNHKVDSFS